MPVYEVELHRCRTVWEKVRIIVAADTEEIARDLRRLDGYIQDQDGEYLELNWEEYDSETEDGPDDDSCVTESKPELLITSKGDLLRVKISDEDYEELKASIAAGPNTTIDMVLAIQTINP